MFVICPVGHAGEELQDLSKLIEEYESDQVGQ